ncbi:MAG: LUD domain-containing protein [Verrucomicrobiae bacterium]|nr:LUD domain-containing protein [Verrucomicrobiae bacterium]
MNARSSILHHIKEALKKETECPFVPATGQMIPSIEQDEILPRFEREFSALKGEFGCAKDWPAAQQWVEKTARKYNFKKIAAMPQDDVRQATSTVQPSILTGKGDCAHQLAEVDLGVSGCDYLIAATGSILLTAQSGFGRALSILPPSHMVVARRKQLVPQLNEAYAGLQSRFGADMKKWPSLITLITGPSRTADIEKILVLGAHGPKQLFVLLLDF